MRYLLHTCFFAVCFLAMGTDDSLCEFTHRKSNLPSYFEHSFMHTSLLMLRAYVAALKFPPTKALFTESYQLRLQVGGKRENTHQLRLQAQFFPSRSKSQLLLKYLHRNMYRRCPQSLSRINNLLSHLNKF